MEPSLFVRPSHPFCQGRLEKPPENAGLYQPQGLLCHESLGFYGIQLRLQIPEGDRILKGQKLQGPMVGRSPDCAAGTGNTALLPFLFLSLPEKGRDRGKEIAFSVVYKLSLLLQL